MEHDQVYLRAAIEQARTSLREGGNPIGAALAVDDVLVGLGHNQRVQQLDPILPAETDCIRNAGRLSPDQYRRATMYTTFSPCPLCSGTILLYGIPRVVIGENANFNGAEEWLAKCGVELKIIDDREITAIRKKFIELDPEIWNEDISSVDD